MDHGIECDDWQSWELYTNIHALDEIGPQAPLSDGHFNKGQWEIKVSDKNCHLVTGKNCNYPNPAYQNKTCNETEIGVLFIERV